MRPAGDLELEQYVQNQDKYGAVRNTSRSASLTPYLTPQQAWSSWCRPNKTFFAQPRGAGSSDASEAFKSQIETDSCSVHILVMLGKMHRLV
eukprot:4966092-Amphidinium_carterae.2